jgi:hypothetical protein
MTFEITDKSFTVFFDNVAVPADRLVGGEGNGLRVAFDGMNPEGVIIVAICNGVSRYALDKRWPTPASVRCGRCRSGLTKASHIRWRKPRLPLRPRG